MKTKIFVVSCSLSSKENDKEFEYFWETLCKDNIPNSIKLGILALYGYDNGNQFFALKDQTHCNCDVVPTYNAAVEFFDSHSCNCEQRFNIDLKNISQSLKEEYSFLILVTYSQEVEYINKLITSLPESIACCEEFKIVYLPFLSTKNCYINSESY